MPTLGHWTIPVEIGHSKTSAAPLHPWAKHILRFGEMLVDFPNYLSIHAGGVIISENP
jgi:DNA polymerase III alpha subunit